VRIPQALVLLFQSPFDPVVDFLKGEVVDGEAFGFLEGERALAAAAAIRLGSFRPPHRALFASIVASPGSEPTRLGRLS
jgi:hypothetical protein